MTPNNKSRTASDTDFELEIDLEKVGEIIQKARMFDVKEELSDPQSGSNATDDRMLDILEDTKDDATLPELLEMIRNLDEDEQIRLVALAWIGRGTYEAGEWQEALNQARAAHNTHTAEYLIGLPLLGDYLEGGLAALRETQGAVVIRRKPRSKSSGFGRPKTK
jgi:hypothetical protein